MRADGTDCTESELNSLKRKHTEESIDIEVNIKSEADVLFQSNT